MTSSLARVRSERALTSSYKPAPPKPSSYDASLIAILDAPLERCETLMAGFARKEAELRATLAALSLVDARQLLKRLQVPQSGDELVARMGRLTSERRARLIAFIADAPRRAAYAGVR